MISQDLAWLAAALPLAGFASYLRDTLRGRVQPNRVSWALWAAAPLIAFAAELAQHTSARAALVTLALGLGPALILAASLASPRAYWRLGRFDWACAAIAASALTAWAVTGQGNAAIALSIAADLLGALPTVAKARADPGSESAGTYLASGAGAVITLLAIPRWQFAAYGFPLYVAIICALITALITLPRPCAAGLAARRVRLAAAAAAALFLLAAAGYTGYQLRPTLTRPALTAIPTPGSTASYKFPPHPARLRHHPARAALPAPDPAPVPPPTPVPAPSGRRPSPTATRTPSPSPGPSPAKTPSPYPPPTRPSPRPAPTPTPAPSPSETYPSPSASGTPSPSPSGKLPARLAGTRQRTEAPR